MVWEGSAGDRRPYPDQYTKCAAAHLVYLHADMAMEERALAKMDTGKTRPRGRYRPDDGLLAFLKAL